MDDIRVGIGPHTARSAVRNSTNTSARRNGGFYCFVINLTSVYTVDVREDGEN